MKLHHILTLFLLTSGIPIFSSPSISETAVTLSPHLLTRVDGFLIKADTIELMRRFQRELLGIIVGDIHTNGHRIGRYRYQGTPHNLHDLCRVSPSSPEEHAQLEACCQQAKNDFIELGSNFRSTGEYAKKFITKLIEESCEKRNRLNSVLLIWVAAEANQEEKLFADHIKTTTDLNTFLTDLYNFLSDIVRSCPRAYNAFVERVKKIDMINQLCDKIPVLQNNQPLRVQFLTYIKTEKLDKLKEESIDFQTIFSLFNNFRRTQ